MNQDTGVAPGGERTASGPTGDAAWRGELLAVLGVLDGRRVLVVGDAGGDLTDALVAAGATVEPAPADAAQALPSACDLVIVTADARIALEGAPAAEAGMAGQARTLDELAAALTPHGCLLMEVPNPWGLRHLVTPGVLVARSVAPHGTAAPGAWGRRRITDALDATGLRSQRWWSVLPSLETPEVLIADSLWEEPTASERIRFLVRRPIAPPPPGQHVDLDPIDAFRSILDQGLARDLGDAHLVLAARDETALARSTGSRRLVVAADATLDRPWATRFELPDDGWTLEPSAASTAVSDGPLTWRPGPFAIPEGENGEDLLIASLLEHGAPHPATAALLEGWWSAAQGAMDGPDGRAIRIDPGCFSVSATGAWALALPSPANAFPMPIHLAAFGALVRLLARRLPSAGIPRGASLTATIGEVAADLLRVIELDVAEPGATLWSVLEADSLARMMRARVPFDDLVTQVRRSRDTTLGELLEGMPVSAHIRTARMAVDAEARVASVASDVRDRDAEIRRLTRELGEHAARTAAAEQRSAALDAALTGAQERIAALEPREAEVELLKGALRDNGAQIRALRADLAAARERDRRFRAETRSREPMVIPLRPPGRVRRVRERLRERQTRDAVLRSGWFDEAWYLERYPDVRASGLDPLVHYLRHGWVEGRDPGPRFPSALYRRRYPDVAVSGIDPLVHHVRHGAREGRTVPVPPESPSRTTGAAGDAPAHREAAP